MDPVVPQKPQPLLVVRPVFDSTLVIVESVIAGIAGVAVGVFLGATFFFILINIIGLGRLVSAGTLYDIFFILSLAISPALYYEMKKNAWKRTVFKFFDDYVEYQDFKFLITRRKGRVRLRDITDVYERASILQSRRVLTTVYMAVPSMAVRGNLPNAFFGLKIADVPENAGLQEKIILLVEEANRRYFQGVPEAPTVTTVTTVTSSAPAQTVAVPVETVTTTTTTTPDMLPPEMEAAEAPVVGEKFL